MSRHVHHVASTAIFLNVNMWMEFQRSSWIFRLSSHDNTAWMCDQQLCPRCTADQSGLQYPLHRHCHKGAHQCMRHSQQPWWLIVQQAKPHRLDICRFLSQSCPSPHITTKTTLDCQRLAAEWALSHDSVSVGCCCTSCQIRERVLPTRSADQWPGSRRRPAHTLVTRPRSTASLMTWLMLFPCRAASACTRSCVSLFSATCQQRHISVHSAIQKGSLRRSCVANKAASAARH